MAARAAAGAARRPGPLGRAAAGAWHVPAALALLVRSPQLWLLALAPALLGSALIAAGLLLGLFALPPAEAWLLPDRRQLAEWLELAVFLALAVALLLAGMAVGLALTLLVSAPLLERLSRLTEARLLPEKAGEACTSGFGGLVPLKTAVVLAAVLPAAGVLALVPLLGPVLAGVWAGALLGWQQTSGPLARHGPELGTRPAWRRRFGWETLGLGLGTVVVLWVPLANLLLAPALAIGATRLVVELGLTPEADPSAAPAGALESQPGVSEPPAAETPEAPPATDGSA